MTTHTVCLRDAEAYAEGGLAKSAKKTADAGRHGDNMVIHINETEYNQLRHLWGEPTVNPKTGVPEFFLSGLKSWFQDNPWAGYAASTVGSALLGPVVGNVLGGIGLPSDYTGVAGGALTGAGIGALTGGSQGAIAGGLLGGTVSPYLSNWAAGTGLGSALGLQNTSTLSNALGLGAAKAAGTAALSSPESAAASAAKSATSGGILGGSGSGSGIGSSIAPLLIGALALGGMGGAGGKQQKSGTSAAAQQAQQPQPGYNSHLQQVDFNRENVTQDVPKVDYYTYGQRPQVPFFKNNRLPDVQAYAAGGGVTPDVMAPPATGTDPFVGYVHSDSGSDGRADDINALLSEGEYVFDAESVALLGNGNSDAGAKMLDQMRENLRKEKGAALAKGEISPPAQAPESYLPGVS